MEDYNSPRAPAVLKAEEAEEAEDAGRETGLGGAARHAGPWHGV